MYEERRGGTYCVLDYTKLPDGHSTLTKKLTLNPGCSIKRHCKNVFCDKVWTLIDGEGEITIEGKLENFIEEAHLLFRNILLTLFMLQHPSYS